MRLRIISQEKIDLAVSHLPKTDRIVATSHFLKEAWMCLHCALTAGELVNKKGFQRWRKRRQLIKTYSGRKLITVSRALQEDVRAIGILPAAMTTIYNPLDLERVRLAAEEKCPFGPSEILQGPLAQGLCELDASALAEAIKRTLSSPISITVNMIVPFLLPQSVQHYLELEEVTKKNV